MSVHLDDAPVSRARRLGPPVRSAVAVTAAVLAVACLLRGLSYPGFPAGLAAAGVLLAATAVALTAASAVRAVVSGRSRVRAVAVLVVVAAVLAGGISSARGADGAPLQARWAASQAAFDAEVAAAGPPPVGSSGFSASYAGPCPTTLGEFRIAECRSLDGGYLFLQAQGALTDDSGIVYLPDGLNRETTLLSELVPLGGPWWAWTCSC